MLLELIFTTSPKPFSSLVSELEGHDGELGTCPFIILCLARLSKDVKLKIGVGTRLIRQFCGDITDSNMIAFIGTGVGNVRVDLSTA